MKTPHTSSFLFRSMLVGITVASSVACGSDFDPVTLLNSLRVLGVRADPPWVEPGQSTELSALVYTPDSEPVSYHWSWCPFTTSASDNFACAIERDELQKTLDAHLPPSERFEVPDYDLGGAPTADLLHSMPPVYLETMCRAVMAQVTPKDGIPPDCGSSFPVTVKLVVTKAHEQVTAMKAVRLLYDDATVGNLNPDPGELWLANDEDRTALTQFPADEALTLTRETDYWLRLDLPADTTESYVDEMGAARKERLIISWFAEAGEFDASRNLAESATNTVLRATNVVQLPEPDLYPSDRVRFYVVIRDDRGGTTWMMRTANLEVQP